MIEQLVAEHGRDATTKVDGSILVAKIMDLGMRAIVAVVVRVLGSHGPTGSLVGKRLSWRECWLGCLFIGPPCSWSC